MPRILLASLFHETHCFVEDITGIGQFRMRRGDEILARAGDGSGVDGKLIWYNRLHSADTLTLSAKIYDIQQKLDLELDPELDLDRLQLYSVLRLLRKPPLSPVLASRQVLASPQSLAPPPRSRISLALQSRSFPLRRCQQQRR